MEHPKLTYLVRQYLDKKATDEEIDAFYEIVRTAGNDEDLRETLIREWLRFTTTEEMPSHRSEDLFNSIIHQANGLHAPSKKVVPLRNWLRAAAAAVVILTGSAMLFFLTGKKERAQPVQTAPAIVKDVPPPTGTKAVIRLANGKTIPLDNVSSGVLAEEGKVDVVKTSDGRILYRGTSTETVYNTLINPRGSNTITLVLSDGSKVWLNSESSLLYPTAFTGKDRTVEITGEAYFEVVKNNSAPFIVKGNGVITRVTGTHFNVNSYNDEVTTKVTLLEGAVSVMKGASSGLLKPSQQAAFNNGNGKLSITTVDVDKTIAWLTDEFSFDDDDLPSVMRQLARWYDLEVTFTGKIPADLYTGIISRQQSLANVLQIIKVAGIKYSIRNKKMNIETSN